MVTYLIQGIVPWNRVKLNEKDFWRESRVNVPYEKFFKCPSEYKPKSGLKKSRCDDINRTLPTTQPIRQLRKSVFAASLICPFYNWLTFSLFKQSLSFWLSFWLLASLRFVLCITNRSRAKLRRNQAIAFQRCSMQRKKATSSVSWLWEGSMYAFQLISFSVFD